MIWKSGYRFSEKDHAQDFATRGRSSMAERQLPKLHTRVRFPSPAPKPFCRTTTAFRSGQSHIALCWSLDRVGSRVNWKIEHSPFTGEFGFGSFRILQE